MGFISHHEIEWRLVGDGMGVMIVCELGMEDRFRPRCGIIATEDSEISLNFLVYPFSFIISLWMVGSGEE